MWLNAHCHLELSHLAGAIPPGLPFVEWLGRLVPLKRASRPDVSAAAARRAIARMRATGTTAVVDLLSLDTSAAPLAEAAADAMQVGAYYEILDFSEAAATDAVDRAVARSAQSLVAGIRVGLGPHAPYSTTAPLLRAAASAAARSGQWLCIHAAETAEETLMMTEGRGPLRDFLAAVLPMGWQPPRMRPIEWLDACGCLSPRTLLVHCNDLNEDDVRRIAARGASVVVCPGSHVYFARGEFPLARLLAAGVPVYLGTDSLASNEDLDMEREVRLAIELAPGVPPDTIRALALADRRPGFVTSD